MTGFCASCPFAGCEGCAYQPRRGTERGLGEPNGVPGVCRDVETSESKPEGEAK